MITFKVKVFTYRGSLVPQDEIERWLNHMRRDYGLGMHVVDMHSFAIPEPAQHDITSPIAECATIVTVEVTEA